MEEAVSERCRARIEAEQELLDRAREAAMEFRAAVGERT
jgi:hypothetical protein